MRLGWSPRFGRPGEGLHAPRVGGHKGPFVRRHRHHHLAQAKGRFNDQRPGQSKRHLGIADEVLHVAAGLLRRHRLALQVGEPAPGDLGAKGTAFIEPLAGATLRSRTGDAQGAHWRSRKARFKISGGDRTTSSVVYALGFSSVPGGYCPE